MHVAHIIDQLDGIGGVQTYLGDLFPALAAKGVESSVLVGRPTAATSFSGARVVSLPETQSDGARLSRSDARRVGAALRGLRVDACMVHVAPSPGLAAAAAAVAPTIVFAHDYFPACPGNARYLHTSETFCAEGPGGRCFRRAYTERCTNRRPDRLLRSTARERAWRNGWGAVARLLVASPFVADVLLADGAPPDRLDVVPYFVQPAAPATDAEECDVLFLGRLVALKGAHVLVRALAKMPGVTAVIGGDGPERPRLEALAHQLGGGDCVRFPGVVSPEGRSRLLAGAKVFALPSLWNEPFGISGLEALAAGVPVVGSDLGGIPSWLIDERVGLRVPAGDDGALASALARILADAALRARMAAAGRETAAEFSIDRHVDGLMRAIDVACAWSSGQTHGTHRAPR